MNSRKTKLNGIVSQESEEWFKSLFDEDLTADFLATPDGEISYCNKSFFNILGFPGEDQRNQLNFFRFFTDEQSVGHFLDTLKREGKLFLHELSFKRPDGHRISTIGNYSLRKDDQGLPIEIKGYIFDITTRKRLERQKRLLGEILAILNRPNDWPSLIRDILGLLRTFTGMEAVGIRLKEGDDYPYFEFSGLSEAFVRKENTLCVRTADGRIKLGSDGLPVLECMCGRVLTGRTDASKPHFTETGSFWTNGMQEGIIREENPLIALFPRGTCAREGFESLALIPLKAGEEVIGLLQFADHRPVMFTFDQIRFYEEIGTTIGIAFQRMEKEKLIRESELKYREIVEFAPVGIYQSTRGGKIFRANPELARILGYNGPQDLYDLDMAKDLYVDGFEREQLIDRWEPVAHARNLELNWKRKDGSLIWITLTAHAVKDINGETLYFEGFVSDAMDRKRAEIALRTSEEFNRSIIESSEDCLKVISDDGTLLSMNAGGKKLMEIDDLETVLNRSWIGFWNPRDQEMVRQEMKKAFHGETGHFRAQCATAKGNLKWWDVIISPIIDHDGHVTKALALSRNITEQVEKEKELEWENAVKEALAIMYAPLTDSASSIEDIARTILQSAMGITGSRLGFVSEVDPQTGNLVVLTLSHIPDDDQFPAGFSWPLTFAPDANGIFRGLYGHTLNTRQPFFTNDAANHPASVGIPPGHVTVEQFLSVPALLDGKPVGIIALANPGRDYTQRDLGAITRTGDFFALAIQRKRAYTELNLVWQKAEEANQLKTSLLKNLNHEFRTPMNAILGFSSLLESEAIDPGVQDMSRRINRAGERLMKTLDDILELSQLESGTGENLAQPLDIYQELREIEPLVQASADRKNLEFSFDVHARPFVLIEAHRFRRVMSHLIDNAIKFTSSGSVTISLTTCQEKNQHWAEIKVSDTGIGIPKEHQGLIFDAFRQASEGYGRTFEGTGLGLTIARAIVGLSGGKITVESELQKGSTFRILMPETRKPIEKEKLVPAVENTGLEGMVLEMASEPAGLTGETTPSILIVEDNLDNVDMTRIFIDSWAHLDVAFSGEEAILKCRKNRYDLILMDINLGPGINGLETTREIQKNPFYEGLPIMAVTGYTSTGDKERIFQAGCSHHLEKPFTKDQLRKAIMEALIRPAFKTT